MSIPESTSRSKRDSRNLRISVVAGTIVALLVVILGAFFAFSSSALWSAQASVIVLPSSDLTPAQETAYYEYLSRGQIVATFAEVGNNAQFVQEAQDKIGMSDEDRAKSSVSLSVVPTTSVVLATATAPSADQAVALANATLELARTYLEGLAVPFRAQVVAGAAPATSTGPSTALILSATLVAAIVAGFATQQLTRAILRARGGRGDVDSPQVPTGPGAPSPARTVGM